MTALMSYVYDSAMGQTLLTVGTTALDAWMIHQTVTSPRSSLVLTTLVENMKDQLDDVVRAYGSPDLESAMMYMLYTHPILLITYRWEMALAEVVVRAIGHSGELSAYTRAVMFMETVRTARETAPERNVRHPIDAIVHAFKDLWNTSIPIGKAFCNTIKWRIAMELMSAIAYATSNGRQQLPHFVALGVYQLLGHAVFDTVRDAVPEYDFQVCRRDNVAEQRKELARAVVNVAKDIMPMVWYHFGEIC